MSPEITVLMAVYNGERYLTQAVNSILQQTYDNFEFLIINDCSQDHTTDILSSIQDSRIRIITNKKNLGLTRSLNIGLNHARGTYIARQDVDDISLPTRLEKQVTFFRSNPQLAFVGAGIAVIDDNRQVLYDLIPPQDPFLLRWRMLFKTTLAHSSVMFDRAKVRQLGGYDASLTLAQDFDLWSRLLMNYQGAALSEILVQWRSHENNASFRRQPEQHQAAVKSMQRNCALLLGKKLASDIVSDLRLIMTMGILDSAIRLRQACDLYQQVYARVLKKWNPKKYHSQKITDDYLTMVKNIALNHAATQKKMTLYCLQIIYRTNIKVLLTPMVLKCILKIIFRWHFFLKIKRSTQQLQIRQR